MKSEKCPFCPKVIEGFTQSQVDWNMRVHQERKHAADFATAKKRRSV